MLYHHSARRALMTSTAFVLLVGCVGPQPITGPPSAGAQPTTRSADRSLRGYYLAKFTTVVGTALPESSFCFRFKSSGGWSNTGSESFSGTYLFTGKELFASALWLPSPAVYLSMQGGVNANQGSGTFIVSGENGDTSAGGTFTMTHKQKSCA
jgi:hypothetical protein